MHYILSTIEQLGQNLRFSIVLLDLGGKRSAENAEILQRSDFFVLLSANVEEINPWQQFAQAQQCETIAILESRLRKIDGVLDQTVRSQIDFTQTPVTGVVWNLDRQGESIAYESAVAQLTAWLYALTWTT